MGYLRFGRPLAASLFIFGVCFAQQKLVKLTSDNSPLPPAAVWDVMIEGDGVWLGTGKGLFFFNKDGVKIFTSKSTNGGLRKDSVVKVFRDSSGCLWVATRSSFIGGGGLSKLCNGVWWLFLKGKTPLPSNFVWDIEEHPKGTLWFATDKGVAVYSNGKWKIYNMRNTGLGLPGDSVWDIFLDREGHLWFATDRGVGWFDGKSWKNITRRNSSMKNDSTSCVLLDSKGRLWIGTRSGYFTKGGLVLYDGRRFTFFHKSDGLPHEDVNCLFEDSKGRLWVGTRGGLAVFEGRRLKTVLEEERVWDIAEDGYGNLYVATSSGLFLILEGSKKPVVLNRR